MTKPMAIMTRPDFSDFFLTEPVEFAPHILTEPDGKTKSPVKTVLPIFQIISGYICNNSH